jgi:hypothetical protein
MSESIGDFSKYSNDSSYGSNSFMSRVRGVWVVILIVIIVVILYFLYTRFFENIGSGLPLGMARYSPVSGSSGYQAVAVDGNSTSVIYFGKIEGFYNGWLYISDVFYLNLANGSSNRSTKPQYSLVHLGPSVSFGPVDQLRIQLNHVIYTSDLSPTSNVYKSIEAYNKANPSSK